MPDFPNLPSELIPYDVFRRRLRELRLEPSIQHPGGSERAKHRSDNLTFSVVHSGYGGGYGGRRPVYVKRCIVTSSSLPEEDARQTMQATLERLCAPGPKVSRYHPESIKRELLVFWEKADSRRHRKVSGPEELADALHKLGLSDGVPRDLQTQLRLYGETAQTQGTSVHIATKKAVIFDGTAADFETEIGSVAKALASSPFSVSLGELHVAERCTTERSQVFAESIARAKKEGSFTWLQVDADRDTELVLPVDADVSSIKAELRQLIDQADSPTYRVRTGSRTEDVKARKLLKMATALRALRKAGTTVSISAGQANARPFEQLVF